MTNSQWAVGSLLIVFVIMIIYLIYRVSKTQDTASEIVIPPRSPRSWASGQIRQEYFGLPEAHRPGVDIDSILKALDTKYAIESVNNHFKLDRTFDNLPYGWNHTCGVSVCPFEPYVTLHEQMDALHKAYAAKEYALALAEQQHGFEQMKQLSEDLVNETLSLVDSAHNIKEGNAYAHES